VEVEVEVEVVSPALISTTLPRPPTTTRHRGGLGSVPVVSDVPMKTSGWSRLCSTLSRGEGEPRSGKEHRRPSGRPQRIIGDLARAASAPKRTLKRSESRSRCPSPQDEEEAEEAAASSLEWTHFISGLLPGSPPTSPDHNTGSCRSPAPWWRLAGDPPAAAGSTEYRLNRHRCSFWVRVSRTEPTRSREHTPSSPTASQSEETVSTGGLEGGVAEPGGNLRRKNSETEHSGSGLEIINKMILNWWLAELMPNLNLPTSCFKVSLLFNWV